MNDENGPRLVDTGRGFTVFYKNRYLYSRIDPAKNALITAQQTDIKAETLVLCFSPVLGYGLEALLEKLGGSSLILALEFDEPLMSFSAAHLNPAILANPSFKYIRTSSVSRVLETIASLSRGPFRRCIRVDLSGGVSFYPVFYSSILSSIDEYISRYWRNHLTLMRLGRNYARNLFSNCLLLPESFKIPVQQSGKTIFVAGAGPSLDDALDFIRAHRAFLFLLSVDTALCTLRDAGLTPDAVVIVESQYWIERAFTGFRNSGIPVYADLTARTAAVVSTGGPVHFFFSEYTKSKFIESFINSGLSPLVIPPLGSVGLAAVYLARIIAKPDVPVIFSGLDFSWGKGFTHSRGSPAVCEISNRSTRLSPSATDLPAYSFGVFTVTGKQNFQVHTDPSLSGYARLCASNFCAEQADNVFDFGTTGMITGCTPWPVSSSICADSSPDSSLAIDPETFYATKEKVQKFLDDERKKLLELKNILSGVITTDDAEKKVGCLVSEMDYLFIHFPDGYKGYSGEKNFLKRIRIELEYFLKTVTSTLLGLENREKG